MILVFSKRVIPLNQFRACSDLSFFRACFWARFHKCISTNLTTHQLQVTFWIPHFRITNL